MNPKLKKALKMSVAVTIVALVTPFLLLILAFGYIGVGIKKVGEGMEWCAWKALDYHQMFIRVCKHLLWGVK